MDAEAKEYFQRLHFTCIIVCHNSPAKEKQRGFIQRDRSLYEYSLEKEYLLKVSRAPVSKGIISSKWAATCTEHTTFASRNCYIHENHHFICNLQTTKMDINLCLTISNSLGIYFQRKFARAGNVTTANHRLSPFITDPCNSFTAAVTCSLQLPFLKQDKWHLYAPCPDSSASTAQREICNEVEIIKAFRMNKMLIDTMQFKGMKGLDKETKTERKQREKVLTSMAAMGFHKRLRVAVSLNTRYIHCLPIGWIHIPHSSNKQ